MKLLDEYEAACKVRRLAVRTIETYRRWIEGFLRFHRDRLGRWIHPKDLGTPEVEAFLTHLPVNAPEIQSQPGTPRKRDTWCGTLNHAADKVECVAVRRTRFHF